MSRATGAPKLTQARTVDARKMRAPYARVSECAEGLGL